MKTHPRLHLEIMRIGLYIVTVLGFAWTLGAQPYRIDWYKVAGGGGSSSGGNYSLAGTAGQPDAGAMTGGQYGLVGGYWAVISVVPMTGSPLLTVKLTGTNTVLVSWPSPSSGFILQQKSELTGPAWVTAPQSVNDDGTNRSIVVNPPAGNLYYRLKK